nr:hypothetical protein [Cedecea neteri]
MPWRAVVLSESTLAGWLGQTAAVLLPRANALKRGRPCQPTL